MEKYAVLKEEGKKSLQSSRYEEAVKMYKEAFQTIDSIDTDTLADANLNLIREKAILFTNIGLAFYNLRLYDKSVEYYKQAEQMDPSYDKSFYRHALCLDKIGEYKDALVVMKTIKDRDDSDIKKLYSRLVQQVSNDYNVRVVMDRLKHLLHPDNMKKVTRVDKDCPEKNSEGLVYQNEKDIEYNIVMMSKGLERGCSVEDVLYLLSQWYRVISVHSLVEWHSRVSKEAYNNITRCILMIVDNIHTRDINTVYMSIVKSSVQSDIRRMYTYIWKQYTSSGVHDPEVLVSIIRLYPIYLSYIDVLNSVSIMLNMGGSDNNNGEAVELFLTSVYNRSKIIGQFCNDSLKNLETISLEENSRVFSEFVERVSHLTNKSGKSFLVMFFKTIKHLCGYKIYRLMYKDIGHLYRDNLSHNSILLMNTIILSDYPSILEDFVKQEKMFLSSIILLIQHLQHVLATNDTFDEQIVFKLDNTYQLLYLCISNKLFLTEISGSKVACIDLERVQRRDQEVPRGFIHQTQFIPSSYSR